MSANAMTSTGLRNISANAWKSALTNGTLRILSGTPPASSDAAETGTLINLVTGPSAAGLTYAATAVAGVLQKNGSQVWSGTDLATGTATYFRLVSSTDSGALSTTEPRIQGTVGTTGESLNLTGGTARTTGGTLTIDSFAIEVPTY